MPSTVFGTGDREEIKQIKKSCPCRADTHMRRKQTNKQGYHLESHKYTEKLGGDRVEM